MRVLVTGGAGFIGTNLVRRLLVDGHEVLSIDNYSTGTTKNHQVGAHYYDGDCSQITDYSEYGEFDVVYHLAALARIQPSFEDPTNYFKSNAVATYNVAMYCAKRNIPLVFAGSSSHHSGKFKNPYTFAKDVSEDILHLCMLHYKLKATIARFYNVYGPYHLKEGGYCTLIGRWEKAIEEGRPIIIYGDGTKCRDFTHVDDIVDALILIKEKEAWDCVFELGRGVSISVKEVADMFQYNNILYEADRPGEAITTLSDDAFARYTLTWNPTRNLQDYIKKFTDENSI